MTEDMTKWNRFQLYVPGMGKIMFGTDGRTVRMIATVLRTETATMAPCHDPKGDDVVPVMVPKWDRATAGPKPEWFDDPKGTFEWLRRERDGLESDARALYQALDELRFQATLREHDRGDVAEYHDAVNAATRVQERLQAKGYGLPKPKRIDDV